MIRQGVIELVPAEGTEGPASGARITDGSYQIRRAQGPGIGSYKFRISSKGPTGRKISQGSLGSAGETVDEIGELIPAEFNEETSLIREIENKHNEINFDLKSK